MNLNEKLNGLKTSCIIVNDRNSMDRIVRKENCGVVIQYGKVESIKDAILKLKNDVNLRQRLRGDIGSKQV